MKNNWGPLSSNLHVGRPEMLTDWKSESVSYLLGSSLFNFSGRATRDADRMKIQKYDLRTDGQTLIGKPSFKKYRFLYEILSQTGGGVNRISYLLFRNVRDKKKPYETIHFYSCQGSFPHILGVRCSNIIKNLNCGWLW